MDGATVCIIGAGPLGIGLAHHLTAMGLRVRFLQRGTPSELSGIVKDARGSHAFHYPPPTLADLKATQAVFVTVKAFDLVEALEQHLPQFTRPIPVISLCNGAIEKLIEKIAQRYPQLKFRLGLSTTGVRSNVQSTYEVTSGRFEWGPLVADQNVSPIESYIFEHSPELFFWHGEPLPALRKKWLFNVVINSIAGSDRLSQNGLLLTQLPQVKLAFREALALGKKEWGPWDESEEALYAQLIALIQRTAQNENSMARDIRLGRPTESAYLAGMAEAHPEFPVLRRLHAQLMLP